MAHTEIDCNDGLDDGNEWISPSVQVSNEIKDHQDEGDGGGGERARRKMMKGEEEDEFDRKKKSGRRGESRRHESNSQRIHVSVLTFPPTYCQCWCPRKPSSIITCHWNHCLISILIILACRRDGRGGGGGGCVMGFPQGAPPEACVSLEPRHFGTQATSTSSDYYLTASSSRFGGVFGFSKSGGVKVELGGAPFKGFLIAAIDPKTNKRIGSWAKVKGTELLPCSAITHSNGKVKKSATLLWYPPPNETGYVTFLASVVQSYEKYFTGLTATIEESSNDISASFLVTWESKKQQRVGREKKEEKKQQRMEREKKEEKKQQRVERAKKEKSGRQNASRTMNQEWKKNPFP